MSESFYETTARVVGWSWLVWIISAMTACHNFGGNEPPTLLEQGAAPIAMLAGATAVLSSLLLFFLWVARLVSGRH